MFAQNGAYDYFDDPSSSTWITDEPDVYSMEVKWGITSIEATDAGGDGNYHGFTYELAEPVNIINNPIFSVKLKAWWELVVRVDIVDENGNTASESPAFFNTFDDGRFHIYYYDFTGAETWQGDEVDLTAISSVLFYFNANETLAYTGEVHIDNIMLGNSGATSIAEDFGDNSLDACWVTIKDSQYSLTELEDTENLEIAVDKVADDYEAFTFYYYPIDLRNNPYVTVDVQSDDDFMFRIDLQDTDGYTTNGDVIEFAHTGSSDPVTYTFDYTDKFYDYLDETVNSKSIEKILVYVNAGGDAFVGDVYIDNLVVGAAPSNFPPKFSAIDDQIIEPGESFTYIDLTAVVTDPENDDITFTFTGNDELVVSIVDGVCSISTPDLLWVGSETVTFIATDSEGNKSTYDVKFTLSEAYSKAGHYNAFDGTGGGSWEEATDIFTAEIAEGETKISIDGAGFEAYDAYAYVLDEPIDISDNPFLSFMYKTDMEFDLRVDVMDIHGNCTNEEAFTISTWDDGYYYKETNTFALGQVDVVTEVGVDFTAIEKVVFYPNPDSEVGITGSFYIDDILLGDYKLKYLLESFDDLDKQPIISPDATYGVEMKGENLDLATVIGEEEFASVVMDLPLMDLSENPYVNVSVKSDQHFYFRVDLQDDQGITTNKDALYYLVRGDGEYHNLTFDFTSHLFDLDDYEVDATNIKSLLMMINPGTGPFEGGITVDYIEIGKKGAEMMNQAPFVDEIPAQAIKQGETFADIDFAEFVIDDSTALADLDITFDSSNDFVFDVVDGVVSISVDETWFGKEIVDITFKDEYGAETKGRVILEVLSDNEKPEISAIPSQTIEQGEAFADIELNDYVKDETADEGIIWTVEDNINLEVAISNQIASVVVKDAAWTGTETVTFTAEDEGGMTASIEVVFTVEEAPENLAPVLTQIPNQSINKGGLFSSIALNDYVTDETADADIEWTVTGGDKISFTITSQVLVIQVTDADWTGSEEITLTAKDEEGLIETLTVTFTVAGKDENLAPQLSAIDNQTIKQGESFTAIALNDFVADETADADITWSITGDDNLEISIVDQTATIAVKDAGWFGTEMITFTAEDEGSLTSAIDVTFTVEEVVINNAPVVSAIPGQSIKTGEVFTSVDLNDYVTDETADADIEWTITGGDKLSFGINKQVLIIQSSDATWTGSETVTLTAKDEEGLTASVEVTFTVAGKDENLAPQLSAIDSQTIKQGEAFTDIALNNFVEDETADADIVWTVSGDDYLTISIDVNVLSAAVNDTGWFGKETITLTAKDEEGLSETIEVVFEVTEYETDAPVIATIPAVEITTDDNIPTISLYDYITDQTADEDLTITVKDQSGFDFSVTDGGLSIVLEDAAWTGETTIEVTVADKFDNESTIEIDFKRDAVIVNNPPVVSEIPQVKITASNYSVNLKGYVEDEDIASITYEVAEATFVTATVENGVLTITPKDGIHNANEKITVTVKDDKDQTATVEIVVVVEVVETATEESATAFSCYPSIATKTLSIETAKPAKATISSIDGRAVESFELPEGLSSIDVTLWEKGIYMIVVETAEAKKAFRIIKK